MNPLADVRDIIANGRGVLDGEDGSFIKLGAAVVGAVPIGGDLLKPILKKAGKELFIKAEKEIVEQVADDLIKQGVKKEVAENVAKEEVARLIKETKGVRQIDELALNEVRKFVKRDWSEAEYQKWFDNLPTKNTPTNKPADLYEIEKTGNKNYTISGNGESFDADGITNKTILEAKFVGNPERSPYIENSNLPDFLKTKIGGDTENEFRRMGIILADGENPLTSVKVITNNPQSVSYFERLMRENNVPGQIIVEP